MVTPRTTTIESSPWQSLYIILDICITYRFSHYSRKHFVLSYDKKVIGRRRECFTAYEPKRAL